MFTGLIQSLGRIDAITPSVSGRSFVISHAYSSLVLGESIAVNGVCLTVTALNADSFTCDVSPETCQLTTFGQSVVGETVNLERALMMGDHLGGHMVSGHVDQVAHILKSEVTPPFLSLEIGCFDRSAMHYLLKKGSVAINGVSLTINHIIAIDPNQAAIALTIVPHTRSVTTLGTVSVGDAVNIEFDMIAKMVARQTAPYLDVETLNV